jgi:hypothetical protein
VSNDESPIVSPEDPVFKGTNLMCFKDQHRPCSAECMAFLTTPPPDREYIGQQWAHCLELVTGHRKAKHLVIIADLLKKQNDLRLRGIPQDPFAAVKP